MNMESKRSSNTDGWTGRRIDFVAFGKELSERAAALGNPIMSRNSGKRRTESKKALLKAIEDLGGKW
jgi:hypothetical protein